MLIEKIDNFLHRPKRSRETPCTDRNAYPMAQEYFPESFNAELNFVSFFSVIFHNSKQKEELNCTVDLVELKKSREKSFQKPSFLALEDTKAPNLSILPENVLNNLFNLLKIERPGILRKIFRYIHPKLLSGRKEDVLKYAFYSFLGSTKALELLAKKFPKDIEIRITTELLKTIWYLQRMNLQNSEINGIINFILKIEPAVRWQERKHQMSRSEPQKKEFVFNHFLEVMRGSLETIDGMRFFYDEFSNQEKEKYKEIFSRDFVITVALASLLHDYIEDKILTKEEIINFLHSSGFYDKKITTEVLELIEIMDFNNYDSHKEYVKAFSSNLKTLIIKNSDMLKSNFRSGIPKKISFDKNGNIKNPAKNEKYNWYSVFLRYELIYHKQIIKIISKENLGDIKNNNKPEFLKKIFFEKIRNIANNNPKISGNYKIDIPSR